MQTSLGAQLLPPGRHREACCALIDTTHRVTVWVATIRRHAATRCGGEGARHANMSRNTTACGQGPVGPAQRQDHGLEPKWLRADLGLSPSANVRASYPRMGHDVRALYPLREHRCILKRGIRLGPSADLGCIPKREIRFEPKCGAR